MAAVTAAAGTAIMAGTDGGSGPMKTAKILTALALLSLLVGCVVYVPYSAPPPRYHYWR